MIVNAHDGAGKSGGFSEGDEDGFVDLSFRVHRDADVEENHPHHHHQGGYKQLYVSSILHVNCALCIVHCEL